MNITDNSTGAKRSQLNTEWKEIARKNSIKDSKISNLSCKTFTEQQLDILKKGLKFMPTPQKNLIDLKNDLKAFTNKLRTIEYLANNNTDSITDPPPKIISLVKKKSTFCAPKSTDKNLENQVDFIANLPIEKINSNKKEWLSLNTMINDKEIILKKANKRGSIDIMSARH